jgi:hypothetical protein
MFNGKSHLDICASLLITTELREIKIREGSLVFSLTINRQQNILTMIKSSGIPIPIY